MTNEQIDEMIQQMESIQANMQRYNEDNNSTSGNWVIDSLDQAICDIESLRPRR